MAAPRKRISPGCANCRSRRIKCNLLSPKCSQCARAGLHCTGYRSSTDTLFRDQTRPTAQRCGLQKPQRPSSNRYNVQINSILPSNIEEVSRKVFLDRFPLMGETCKRAMESRLSQSSSAATGMISVGLVALATVEKDPRIMQLARVKYEIVLRQLTEATLQPWDTPIEQSIGASYFLSIFEMFANDDYSTSYSWLKHIDGTSAFLQTSIACRDGHIPPMKEALNICFTKASACLINMQPVPHFLTELTMQYEVLPYLTSYEEQLLPVAKLFPIFSDLVNLFVSETESSIQYAILMESAFTKDLALQHWAKSFLQSRDQHDSRRNSITNTTWFLRMESYYCLGRIIARLIIENEPSLTYQEFYHHDFLFPLYMQRRQQNLQSAPTISILEDEIYANLLSILRYSPLSQSGIYLSADLYFIIIMLQSLLRLTNKERVVRRLDRIHWGDKETFTRKVLLRHVTV